MGKSRKIKMLTPLTALTAASMITVSLGSCSKQVSVTDVKFDYEYSYVETGNSRDFSTEVKVLPENAFNKKLKWSISDQSGKETVATVDEETGVVTGKANGYCKLTCESTDGSAKSSQQWVIVGKYIELEDFNLQETELDIPLEESQQIHTEFVPSTATTAKTQHVKWTSSDETIATVDETGKVTANQDKNTGSATITAVPYDYDSSTRSFQPKEELTKTCTVNVDYAYPEKLVLSPETLSVKTEQTFSIHHNVLPHNAKQDVTFDVYPEGSVEYDSENDTWTAGTTTGTATIIFKAAADESITATCAITILPAVTPVETIKFDEHEHSFMVGEHWQPTVTITPAEASWDWYLEVEDTSIADIRFGYAKALTAKKPGTTNVKVYCADGSKSDTCVLTVDPIPVTKVSLPSTTTIGLEETGQLTPTVEPEEATDKSVNWKSSDESVVKVTDEGTLYALKLGTATITATSVSNPTVVGSCTVTVAHETELITSITIPEKIDVMLSTSTEYISDIAILPTTATNKELEWRVQDKSVLSIARTEEGDYKIIPKKVGTTKILARACDGSEVASNECTVTIKYDPIESFSIEDPFSMPARTYHQIVCTILPETACKDVRWTSDSPFVATVDDSGLVRSVAEGEAKITCKSLADPSRICTTTVTVTKGEKIPVTKINFAHESDHNISIHLNEQRELPEIVYHPEDATNRSVHWTISDDQYFYIDYENKMIVPKKETPDATIVKLTAVSNDNESITAVADVTIKKVDATGIEIVTAPDSIEKQDPQQLKVKVLPEGAKQNVRFECLNPNLIQLEDASNISCNLRGLAPGDATVRISSVTDPNVYIDKKVKVIDYISFLHDTWENIAINSDKDAEAFKKAYCLDYDRNKDFPNSLVGYKKKMTLNDNLVYEFRVIGQQHDTLANGGKANLTLELTSVVCGSDKRGLNDHWDSDKREFINSVVCHNLNGGSHKTWSKPMIDYVRASGIGDHLKLVKKECYYPMYHDWSTIKHFNVYLFPLTLTELNEDDRPKDEGETYWYYSKMSRSARRKDDLAGGEAYYWSMSQNFNSYTRQLQAYLIMTNGKSKYVQATNGNQTSFAFCL